MTARALKQVLGSEAASTSPDPFENAAELTSRPLLLDRLEQGLLLGGRQKHMVAVLLVELDNMRMVNRLV